MPGLLHESERSAKIGIVARGPLLNFSQRRQRDTRMQIVSDIEIVVEVRKNEYREIEARIQQGKLGFLKLAAALLHLQFGFNGVGVGNFPATLQILRELQKTIPFVRGF